MACLMGIDPGKNGAICVVDRENGVHFFLLKEFLANDLKGIHYRDGISCAYLEKAQAMPGQGVSSMFNYGTRYGRIMGWLEMLFIPYVLVPPQTWTKEMHQGCTGNTSKDKSKQAIQRLFPNEDFCLPGKKKIHEGLMDARLIAEYGRRVYK